MNLLQNKIKIGVPLDDLAGLGAAKLVDMHAEARIDAGTALARKGDQQENDQHEDSHPHQRHQAFTVAVKGRDEVDDEADEEKQGEERVDLGRVPAREVVDAVMNGPDETTTL